MRPAIRLRRAERRRGSGMLIRLPATRCLNSSLHFVIAVHVGSDGASTRVRQEVSEEQAVTQFLQALLPEVTYAEQILFIHRKHLAHLRDIAALEAVISTNREVQLFDRRIVNFLRDRQAAQRSLLRLGQRSAIIGQQSKMPYQDIRALAQRLIRRYSAVRRDFKNDFIKVG